ncbi:GntR family transcriptional regulator [Lentzea sp. NPDC051208]|uniref:GntR family transcriptional regulator n=1 Tax=Lentzea sp. NPDC051208 TaxID=3154642 RepID=UPI00341F10F3
MTTLRDLPEGGSSPRPAMPRLTRKALADEVYEALRAMVMDSALAAGTRLTTDALATELGVSRTPVRESLVRLEAEGLVNKRAQIGYAVAAPLDGRSLEELFAVRLLLEPAAARLAAEWATQSQVDELEANDPALRAVPASGSPYEDYRAFVSEDARFHSHIARASGNRTLHESIDRLHAHVHTYRLWTHGGTPINAMKEHAAIADAVRQRDPQAAEEAMREHLTGSLERLRTAL